MAKRSIDELMKETEGLFQQEGQNSECTYLQREYESLLERYESAPPQARAGLAAQLRAIARSLQLLHCGVPVLS